MNFYGVFLVCKRSNRDKVKFRSAVFVNSALCTRVSLSARAMNIFVSIKILLGGGGGGDAKFIKLIVEIHIKLIIRSGIRIDCVQTVGRFTGSLISCVLPFKLVITILFK